MLWSFWQSENALFHGETGETHLLADLPTAVLQVLLESPRSTTDLYALTAAQCQSIADDRWSSKVDSVLRALAALHLVEQRYLAE
ncbi:MAG TPA: hypothetical protein DDY14_14140 [Chromatiaceae bacterium]|jgi:hypothetical protein|nr:MAG: hypothetical protein N838_21245 [Thiohalocapsa sp. PB-PSB1]HBG96420.1 hypothetical protein [Chromatiaceae bacterium]HCS92645.1 hypothetical protein [Chromatiaceae bacterium]